MPSFGKGSLKHLNSCDPKIKKLFTTVVKTYDCSAICGHRDKAGQDEAVRKGNSKTKWPNSKHNGMPSRALDIAPYPIDWGIIGPMAKRKKAINRFYHFAGYVLATAERLNIKVRWGGDWDGDKDFSDQNFDDLVHWELVDDS
jgi:peptidoglycan L-alanyl-D-glutamate endopeptidase CwlK